MLGVCHGWRRLRLCQQDHPVCHGSVGEFEPAKSLMTYGRAPCKVAAQSMLTAYRPRARALHLRCGAGRPRPDVELYRLST
eukprot:2051051-Prymnesium_polylepis.1